MVAMFTFLPKDVSVPGSLDPEVLRDKYLDAEADDMILQMVSETTKCISRSVDHNKTIAFQMRWMLVVFMAQVFCVAMAVGTRIIEG